MDYTGERFVPELSGPARYEHLHRYALSRDLVQDKLVLDLACGEGYGAALLAATARSVTGVDIDAATIAHAQQRYGSLANLSFRVGACEAVPLPDHSVDVVISFETIEHHAKHDEMMGEIKRVLRPDGFLVISSPNRDIYPGSPFHVRELSETELRGLLQRYFRCVRLYGQRLAAASFVFSVDASAREAVPFYEGTGHGVARQLSSLARPAYFLAVCSQDGQAAAPSLESVYIEKSADLADKLEAELTQLRSFILGLTHRRPWMATRSLAAWGARTLGAQVKRAAAPASRRAVWREVRQIPSRLASVSYRISMRARALVPGALIPPARLHRLVGGGFIKVGREFCRHFIELCHLQPHEAVLDVGCGVGRVAVPLTQYLSGEGRYEGFDVMPEAVAWCQQSITPRFPRFRFQLADLYNSSYNPQGRHQAADFPFPYPDDTFDFVFLASVFTHLLPADMDHYLAEIARVLKPGGRCLATYFLLNAESQRRIQEGRALFRFRQSADKIHGWVNDAHPEDAVAYPESHVLAALAKHGLEISLPVRYGSWSTRPDYLSFQDIVVATKQPRA